MSEKHIIQTPSLFKVDDSFQDERFMKVRIAAMHSGKNLNQSKFSTSVIRAAKDSFANIPILANIIVTTDEDGNQHMDYGSHDMHIEDDFFNADHQRIIYDEKVVGVVPEQNNFELIRDEETGNDYAWVDALIYRDYGNYCADILESRGGSTSVSAEISCEEISYDSKDKALQVDKMKMCAITLLGEDVKPGMAKAHATAFSIDDDSREKQIIDIMQELKESLDKYITAYSSGEKNSEEGGTDVKKKFEEDSEAEVKTTAEVDSTEETKVETPSENFDGDGDTDPDDVDYYGDDGDGDSTGNDSDPSDDGDDTPSGDDPDPEPEPSGDDEDEPEGIPIGQKDDDDEGGSTKKPVYSIEYTVDVNGIKNTFAVTLRDKLMALTTLVNDTYADEDGAWYDVDADEDTKTVIFHDYWNDKHYRQLYTVKKGVYSLKGDRTEVFATYLSADEISQLDNMKANYSSIVDELASFKAEPDKEAVLADECYAQIKDTDAYKELAKKESHFSMSVDEVRGELDKILLEYAKGHEIKFSTPESKKPVGMKLFGNPSKKASKGTGRYGGIFTK